MYPEWKQDFCQLLSSKLSRLPFENDLLLEKEVSPLSKTWNCAGLESRSHSEVASAYCWRLLRKGHPIPSIGQKKSDIISYTHIATYVLCPSSQGSIIYAHFLACQQGLLRFQVCVEPIRTWLNFHPSTASIRHSQSILRCLHRESISIWICNGKLILIEINPMSWKSSWIITDRMIEHIKLNPAV